MLSFFHMKRLISRMTPRLCRCEAVLIHSTAVILKRPPQAKRDPVKFSRVKVPRVKVWPGISLAELAEFLNVSEDGILDLVRKSNLDEAVKSGLSIEASQFILSQYGYRAELVANPESVFSSPGEDKDAYPRSPADPCAMKPRPPVVTIMGHVDHGKTTLLDALRESQIVDSEFGGITQHIGAFSVKLPATGSLITFLDTPGHAAFAAMRQRGAKATDMVVLVVAADDGVMEQTRESIRFARVADVPIIVAINKCDRPNADIERSKRSLLEAGLVLEEFGGDVPAVQISALKRHNLDALQETIVALAEMKDIRAEYDGPVEGVVIESQSERGRGKIANVLIQRGTLRRASILTAGLSWCKVRQLLDEHGVQVKEATPSKPVQVVGWRGNVPSSGSIVIQLENEHRAKEVVNFRLKQEELLKLEQMSEDIAAAREVDQEIYQKQRDEKLAAGFKRFFRLATPPPKHVVTSDLDGPRFNVILKGDVDGSVSAIMDVISSYSSSKCKFNLLDCAVGQATEQDVKTAQLADAVIYCFNVESPPGLDSAAAALGVTIKHFNIIYRLVEDFKNELSQRLPMIDDYETLGEGSVIASFEISVLRKKANVAGVECKNGSIKQKENIRFLKDGEVYYDGSIETLRKQKDIVSSFSTGDQVAVMVPDYNLPFEVGDRVQSYRTFKVAQRIDWNPPGF